MKTSKFLFFAGIGALLLTLSIKKISSNGVARIAQFEAYREYPYQDQAGIWTVGYGHVIKPTEDFSKGISKTDALALLQKDLAPVESAVTNSVKVKINQNQYDALCSFAYNVGITAFENSTLLSELNQGNYNAAASQFVKWDHIHKNGSIVVDPGLLARRQKEESVFLS